MLCISTIIVAIVHCISVVEVHMIKINFMYQKLAYLGCA